MVQKLSLQIKNKLKSKKIYRDEKYAKNEPKTCFFILVVFPLLKSL